MKESVRCYNRLQGEFNEWTLKQAVRNTEVSSQMQNWLVSTGQPSVAFHPQSLCASYMFFALSYVSITHKVVKYLKNTDRHWPL